MRDARRSADWIREPGAATVRSSGRLDRLATMRGAGGECAEVASWRQARVPVGRIADERAEGPGLEMHCSIRKNRSHWSRLAAATTRGNGAEEPLLNSRGSATAAQPRLGNGRGAAGRKNRSLTVAAQPQRSRLSHNGRGSATTVAAQPQRSRLSHNARGSATTLAAQLQQSRPGNDYGTTSSTNF